MKRRSAARRLQSHNQWASFVQMLFEVFPLSANCKRTESFLPEVPLHVGSIDAVSPRREQGALNRGCIGVRTGRLALLTLPVLHHHGDAGSSTAVLFLLYEGYVEPNSGEVCGKHDSADPQHHQSCPESANSDQARAGEGQTENNPQYGTALSDRNNDEDQHG